MKKKAISFLLAAVLVLSMPTALFAAEVSPVTPITDPVTSSDTGIAPMSTTTANIGVSRISSTKGSVSAYGSFDEKAKSAICSITIQVKSNGIWKTASDLPVYSYIKTAYNVYAISASKTFTLKSGKTYRAKVVFTDTNTTGTHISTYYSGSF